MTVTTASSPPTLASVYIDELRAKYPELPWGPLCTGTDKEQSHCYALQVTDYLCNPCMTSSGLVKYYHLCDKQLHYFLIT